MAIDREGALGALLVQAEEAHGVYEATELHGVYDQQWMRWYAVYAVEHGIAALLNHAVTADRLAQFLATTFADFQRVGDDPGNGWAAYTARRILTEL